VIRRAIEAAWGQACEAATECSLDRLGVALFRGDAGDERHLASPAMSGVVTVTLDLERAILRWSSGGAAARERPADLRLLLAPAGEASDIVVSGPWRLLQLYIPAASIDGVAAEFGLPQASCKIVFDPGFFDDPELEVIARALEKRLAVGLVPTGLETDELALDVALLLITRHARLDLGHGLSIALPECPVAGGKSSLDNWERALLAEIFEQLRDSPQDAPQLLQGLLLKLASRSQVTRLQPRR
jgi:hypothetical protein